jgi:phosphatidylglycerophosphatase A
LLFRYFDITKPQPARYFDEHVKNGFGVMADDLVAAGYTLLLPGPAQDRFGLTPPCRQA